jgi:hypothetical protein
MKRSLKYSLITAAAISLYSNIGWTIGYYWSNPSLITSPFWKMVLNPLGEDLIPVVYESGYQVLAVVFVPILLMFKWFLFILGLFFYGGVAKLFIS